MIHKQKPPKKKKKKNHKENQTCLLLQSSTTTLSGLTARNTRSTSAADALEIWVVPTNHIASGSTNSVLQAGTGPNRRFSINTKLPASAKSSNSGQDFAIVALDSCNISDLKSKSGGGGLIEAFMGLVGLVVRIFGYLKKIGNLNFSRVPMDENEMALCACVKCLCAHGLDKVTNFNGYKSGNFFFSNWKFLLKWYGN